MRIPFAATWICAGLVFSQVQTAAAPFPEQSGSVFRDCAHCPEMIVLPAGTFNMGLNEALGEADWMPEGIRNRTLPARSIDLPRFAIGRYEVNVAEYRAFSMATQRPLKPGCEVWADGDWTSDASRSWQNPGFPQDDSHPVTCVGWRDAQDYVAWLSAQTGHAYQLLSEAQWEYAARAGSAAIRTVIGDETSSFCLFGNVLDRSAVSALSGGDQLWRAECDDGYRNTAPVGRFRPNAFGVYDMIGNVFEWLAGCMDESAVDGSNLDGSANLLDCSRPVIRGGGWMDAPILTHPALRWGFAGDQPLFTVGFRVARVR
ncbi:MAG: hypothetical protein RL322_1096 [Pseudomonadota bacterium]|jgi:formylglycine-generating enzyme required for sulfatase activity